MSTNPYLSPESDFEHGPATQSEAVLKGRRLVATIAWLFVAISAMSIASLVSMQGTERLVVRLVRFGFTVLIAVNLYRGAAWARWLSVVLYSLGAFGAAFAAFVFVNSGFVLGAVAMAAMAIAYGVAVVLLTTSSSVSAYFESCR